MTSTASAPPDEPMRWAALVALCLALLAGLTESSMLALSIRDLVVELNTSLGQAQVASAVYPFIAGSFVLVASVLGLRYGMRRALVVGLLIYCLGALVCAISPNFTVFVFGGRSIAAIGGALMTPMVFAMAAFVYEGHQRAIAFAALAATTGLAVFTGFIAAGSVIDRFGFRVAYGCVAAMFAVAALGCVFVPRHRPPHPRPAFDLVGAALSTVSIALILLGFITAHSFGVVEARESLTLLGVPLTPFGISFSALMVGLGALMWWGFIRWERRRESRNLKVLLPTVFVASPPVRAGMVLNVVQYFALAAVMFVIPSYAQTVVGSDALVTGMVLTIAGLGVVAGSIAPSWVAKKATTRRICQHGLLVGTAGLLAVAGGMRLGSLNAALFVGLALVGIGLGIIGSQNANVVTSGAPVDSRAQAGGVVAMTRSVGGAVGGATVGLILMVTLTTGFHGSVLGEEGLTVATRHAVAGYTDIEFISSAELTGILQEARLGPQESDRLRSVYEDARQQALMITMLIVAGGMALALLVTPKLPAGPASAIGPPVPRRRDD